MADSNLVQLTGLWIQKGKSGDFLSGNVGRANYLLFKNHKKEKPNEPDYYLCIAPSKPKQEEKPDDSDVGF